MSICKNCRNHDKCRFNFKDTVNTCSFIYPDEIPIIHGKAELEEHDKEIKNKAIDDFVANVKDTLITDYSVFNTDDIRIFIDIIEELVEQLKAGGENEMQE